VSFPVFEGKPVSVAAQLFDDSGTLLGPREKMKVEVAVKVISKLFRYQIEAL
jgi:hypothetical protein